MSAGVFFRARIPGVDPAEGLAVELAGEGVAVSIQLYGRRQRVTLARGDARRRAADRRGARSVKGEGLMERMRAALDLMAAKLTRARTIREAVARAKAEEEAVAGRLDGARRALVQASADAAAGAPVAPAALEALRADLIEAERDGAIRAEVADELELRLEACRPQLEDARDAMIRALAAAVCEAEGSVAALVAEAKRVLTPGIRALAELRYAGAEGAALSTAAQLAGWLGIPFEHGRSGAWPSYSTATRKAPGRHSARYWLTSRCAWSRVPRATSSRALSR